MATGDPQFTTLATLITVILVIAVIALYFAIQSRGKDAFSKALIWSVAYMVIHTSCILFIEIFYGRERWIDRLAPFALVYGPMLLLCFTAVKDGRLPIFKVLLHLTPFTCFALIYIFLITGVIPPTIENQRIFLKYTGYVVPLSFGSYTIWSVVIGKAVLLNRMRGRTLLFIFGQIILLFACMLSVAVKLADRLKGNEHAAFFIRAAIYCCMLVCLLVILYYTIRKFRKQRLDHDVELRSGKRLVDAPRYDRSAITTDLLRTYGEKLNAHVHAKKVYLDKNLSLSTLAKQIKIPSHHLTQVFSLQVKKTFYQYINELRVEHACMLLSDPAVAILIEDIAEICGFNSKAAFNRNFKELMSVTPSEYREQTTS